MYNINPAISEWKTEIPAGRQRKYRACCGWLAGWWHRFHLKLRLPVQFPCHYFAYILQSATSIWTWYFPCFPQTMPTTTVTSITVPLGVHNFRYRKLALTVQPGATKFNPFLSNILFPPNSRIIFECVPFLIITQITIHCLISFG